MERGRRKSRRYADGTTTTTTWRRVFEGLEEGSRARLDADKVKIKRGLLMKERLYLWATLFVAAQPAYKRYQLVYTSNISFE